MNDKNKGKKPEKKPTRIDKIHEDDKNLNDGVRGFWKALGKRPPKSPKGKK